MLKRMPWLVVALAMLLAIGSTTAAETDTVDAKQPDNLATAIFAGGCFWCEEAVFDSAPGVVSVTSGYTGGTKANPTYEEVSGGGTEHAESVRVVFDPATISCEKLLDLFWHNIDPLTANAQFCDRGNQYRAAIFYVDETQKRLAEASKAALEKSGRFNKPIMTEIVPASTFWPAEEYHQKYHLKNPLRYKYYRYGCGRDRRLEELWGPTDHSS